MYAVIFCMTKSYKVIEKNIEKSKVNFLNTRNALKDIPFPLTRKYNFTNTFQTKKIITTQKILFSDVKKTKSFFDETV